MPGPQGEKCQTCYYYENNGTEQTESRDWCHYDPNWFDPPCDFWCRHYLNREETPAKTESRHRSLSPPELYSLHGNQDNH